MKEKNSFNEKGTVLAVVLIMLGLFCLIGIGAVITSSVDTKISGNYRIGTQAFYSADAGIQDAFRRLVTQTIQDTEDPHTTTWNDNCNPSPCSSSGFNNSFTVTHKVLNGAVTMDEFNTPLYLIRSIGTDGNSQKTIEAIIRLTYNRPFTEALHGCNGVTVASNGFTDSYNSAAGTYESQIVANRKDNQNNIWAKDRGHIGTSNSNAHINIEGNAQVHGNASATGNVGSAGLGVITTGLGDPSNLSGYKGPDGTLLSNAVLYKEQRENQPPSPCDPLDINNLFDAADDIVTSNNNGEIVNLPNPPNYPYNGTTGNFSLGSNDAFTLGSAGQDRDYHFTGFELNSNSELNIQGNTTFYINGNFTLDSNSKLILASGARLTVYVTGNTGLDSNTITNPGAPSNLKIYSSATSFNNTDYKVNISSNSNINGSIYSPNAAINISSNANMKGAFRGSFINSSSNSKFHYDEALGSNTDGGGPTGYVLVSWREVI